jgi:1-acyl-sn-glycerol-3-phosphate acyltransferase
MGLLCSSVPSIDESMADQKELSQISDEEFAKCWQNPSYKWYQTLYQIICFFVFLGPIRIVLGVGLCVIIGVIVVIIRVTTEKLGFPEEFGKEFCLEFFQFGCRFLYLAMGYVWIKINGKIDNTVRFVLCNHAHTIDGFIMGKIRKFKATGKVEYTKIPGLGRILNLTDPIWVDRTQATGRTKLIIEHANRLDKPPVLVFPEATFANGDVVLRFHTGAFLTKHKIQPMCVRYWQPL